jgi:hypothetical protein
MCVVSLSFATKRRALPDSFSRPLRALCEMHAHPARSESDAAAPPARHPRSRRASTFAFPVRPSLVYVVRGRRPLRAYCEMRPHPAPSELLAAAPTAFHPRPRCASTLAFELLPRRSAWSEAAGRWGHMVKCARNWCPVAVTRSSTDFKDKGGKKPSTLCLPAVCSSSIRRQKSFCYEGF